MTHTTRCQEIRSRLSGYHDGALPEAVETNVRNHLDECAGCRRELAAISGVARLVAASVVDAGPGFEEKLAARIAVSGRAGKTWTARGRMAKRMSVASAAALLALLLGLGPTLLQRFPAAAPKATDEQILDLALFGAEMDEWEGIL